MRWFAGGVGELDSKDPQAEYALALLLLKKIKRIDPS
jgi:hypothetical protein